LVQAPAEAPRAVRINITVPERDLARIDAVTAKRGYNRSNFLVTAARHEIEREEATVAGG
jgi:metal-responsive CopG/Arc/MetJ family transcriptional regulator